MESTDSNNNHQKLKQKRKDGIISNPIDQPTLFAMDPELNRKRLIDLKIRSLAMELSRNAYLEYRNNNIIEDAIKFINSYKLPDDNDTSSPSSSSKTSNETIIIDIESGPETKPNDFVTTTISDHIEIESQTKQLAKKILIDYVDHISKKRKPISKNGITNTSTNGTIHSDIISEDMDDQDEEKIVFFADFGTWITNQVNKVGDLIVTNAKWIGNGQQQVLPSYKDDENLIIESNNMIKWLQSDPSSSVPKQNITDKQILNARYIIDLVQDTNIIEASVPILFTVVNKGLSIPKLSKQKDINTANTNAISNTTTNNISESEKIDMRGRDKRLKFYVDMLKYGVLIPECIWEEIKKIYAHFCAIRTKLVAEHAYMNGQDLKAQAFESASDGWFLTEQANPYESYSNDAEIYEPNNSDDDDDNNSDNENLTNKQEYQTAATTIPSDIYTDKKSFETTLDLENPTKSIRFADADEERDKYSNNSNNTQSEYSKEQIKQKQKSIANQYHLKKRSSLTSKNKSSPPPNHHHHPPLSVPIKKRSKSNKKDQLDIPDDNNDASSTSSSSSNGDPPPPLSSYGVNSYYLQSDPPEVQAILKEFSSYQTNTQKFIADRAINFYRWFYESRKDINMDTTENNYNNNKHSRTSSSESQNNGLYSVDNRNYILLTMRHLSPYIALKLLNMKSSDINKLSNNKNEIHAVPLSTEDEPPTGTKNSYVIVESPEESYSISSILFHCLKIYGILDLDCIEIKNENDCYFIKSGGLQQKEISDNIKLVNNANIKKIKDMPAVISHALKVVPDIYWKTKTLSIKNTEYAADDNDIILEDINDADGYNLNENSYLTTLVSDIKSDFWLNLKYDKENQELDINGHSTYNTLSDDCAWVILRGEWHKISMLLDDKVDALKKQSN